MHKDPVIIVGDNQNLNEVIQKVLFDFGYLWTRGKYVLKIHENNYFFSNFSIRCDIKNKMLTYSDDRSFKRNNPDEFLYFDVNSHFGALIDYLKRVETPIPLRPQDIAMSTDDINVILIIIKTDGDVVINHRTINQFDFDKLISKRNELLQVVDQWAKNYGHL